MHVLQIDAHDENQISQALVDAKNVVNQPSIIMAKSIIGKFAPNKQDTSGVHGSPLGSDEMEEFKNNIDWAGDVFDHDEEIYDYFEEKRKKDNNTFSEWTNTFNKKYEMDNDFKKNWDLLVSNEISIDLKSDKKALATRIAGSNVLKNIGEATNRIIGCLLYTSPSPRD